MVNLKTKHIRESLGAVALLLSLLAPPAMAGGGQHSDLFSRIEQSAQQPDGLKALAPYLRHRDETVRIEATLALDLVRDPNVYLTLSKLSSDPSKKVRSTAISVLARDKGDLAVGALARYLTDKEPALRSQALNAMGQRANPVAIAYLGEVSTHQDPSMRREAVALLEAQARGEHRLAVAQALLPYLGDPSLDLRVAAVTGLGQTGDPILIQQVAGLYESPHIGLRLAAVDSLRKTWDKRGAVALIPFVEDQDAGVRSKTFASLAKMGGSQAFQALVNDGLSDPDWAVRLEVASHVSELRLDDGIPMLVQAVASAEMEYKRPLIEELNRMGTASSKAALIELNREGSAYEQLLVAKIVSNGREVIQRRDVEMWDRLTDQMDPNGFVRRQITYDPTYGRPEM